MPVADVADNIGGRHQIGPDIVLPAIGAQAIADPARAAADFEDSCMFGNGTRKCSIFRSCA
jgi:hypothetical protein